MGEQRGPWRLKRTTGAPTTSCFICTPYFELRARVTEVSEPWTMPATRTSNQPARIEYWQEYRSYQLTTSHAIWRELRKKTYSPTKHGGLCVFRVGSYEKRALSNPQSRTLGWKIDRLNHGGCAKASMSYVNSSRMMTCMQSASTGA